MSQISRIQVAWMVILGFLSLHPSSLRGQAIAEGLSKSAVSSLFPPLLRKSLDREGGIPLPWLRQHLEALRKEQALLSDGKAAVWRRGDLIDEIAAIEALCENMQDFQTMGDDQILAWVKERDARTPDLERIRGQSRLLRALASLAGCAILNHDADLARKTAHAVDQLLAMTEADPSPKGNMWEGVDFSDAQDPRRQNYNARDAAFLRALRYALTSDKKDAERARDILLEFGRVMPAWSVFTREGQEFPRGANASLDKYLAAGGDNGLWGTWYPLEMNACFPLVQAFALIRPTLDESEQAAIQTTVFSSFRDFLEPFDFATQHNLLVFHIGGTLLWGLALEQPELIHDGLSLMDHHLRQGFFPDGYWKELTPDYHRQVLTPLLFTFPALLEGYSDPEGYSHPESGERYDNLDLRALHREELERFFSAWMQTRLPDNTQAALTDAEANAPQNWVPPSKKSASRLFGTSGLAILGSGENPVRNELFLLFKGTHGHQHEDALAILWYVHGLEVLSETTYRGPLESQALRPWYRTAAAHDTVIVDGRPHFSRSGKYRVPQENRLWPEASGVFSNQGKLLIYDTRLPEAQFVQAQSERACAPLASKFQRTLVSIPLEDGDACLVDIFEVSGGHRHDYMLHAGLNQPHTASVSTPGITINGTAYEQIRLKKSYPMGGPLQIIFRHAGGVNLRADLLSPLGPQAELLEGEGPAIRRTGTAPYFIWRNNGGQSVFVAIYTAFRKKDPVIRVENLSKDPGALALQIATRGHKDLILYALEGSEGVQVGGLSFQGRLGFVRYSDSKPVLAHIAKGTSLADGGAFSLECPKEQTDMIAPNQKSDQRSLALESAAPESADLIHLDFGDRIRWSYPIVKSSGGTVTLQYPRGFEVDAKEWRMVSFPGWRGTEAIHWTIPQQATWRRPQE